MKNVPKLNVSYWLIMLLCTTMGELIGNLLSRNFQLGYTQGALLDICIFCATILVFMSFRLKNEICYWVLILMGNIGGTNLADWVTLEPLDNDKKWGFLKPLELGTKFGSLAVLGALAIVLLFRYGFSKKSKGEGTATSVLYWLAILLSSTFGTTSGDLITNDTPLGAFGGSIFLLINLAVVYAAYSLKKIKMPTTYWSALVLMHPVGATIGNYVSKPIGLNLGNVYTNVVMAVLFALIYVVDSRLTTKPMASI